MDLVNQTAVPARVDVTTDTITDEAPRIGMLVAKATFRFDGRTGRTELDTQDPYPLFDVEEETDLGHLPSDAVQRRDPVFEVIVLGAAHAPGGRPVPSMNVALSVGDVTRSMRVTGDRGWTGGSRPMITRPVPFYRMPLTFDRAYGGMCPAHMDLDTIVDLRDPINHHGRGFDAALLAKHMAESLQAPEGFPRLDYLRQLPNLEHPDHLIQRWDDEPEPYCWATVPQDIGFTQIRFIRRARLKVAAGQNPAVPDELSEVMLTHAFHRAHPDWIIDLPKPRTRVTMTGLSPTGALSFEIPALRVIGDYVVGERRGSRELVPQLMTILPEESRLCIVYRAAFTVETTPEMERSFRLRLDDGWFQHPEAR